MNKILAAGGAAFGLLAFVNGGRAEPFHASYNLSMYGMTIGVATAAADIAPQSYKLEIRVKLTGLAAMVAKTQGAATATGAIANGAVVSTGYANTTVNTEETRTVRMGFVDGTVKAVDISPPFLDNEGRLPVTDAHKSGVIDPVSALIMPVPAGQPLVGPTACNRIIPVYDGLVRFNVSLQYTGTREVQAKGYSGPVTVCSARYAPIAGYRPDSKSTQYMANNKRMEAWLAPIPSAHMVAPFQVSIATTAGVLTISATDFKVGEGQ